MNDKYIYIGILIWTEKAVAATLAYLKSDLNSFSEIAGREAKYDRFTLNLPPRHYFQFWQLSVPCPFACSFAALPFPFLIITRDSAPGRGEVAAFRKELSWLQPRTTGCVLHPLCPTKHVICTLQEADSPQLPLPGAQQDLLTRNIWLLEWGPQGAADSELSAPCQEAKWEVQATEGRIQNTAHDK